jgi:hypothetical protein
MHNLQAAKMFVNIFNFQQSCHRDDLQPRLNGELKELRELVGTQGTQILSSLSSHEFPSSH